MRVPAKAWLPLYTVFAAAGSTSAATTLIFSLDGTYTTSAGIFSPGGALVRTLWSGRELTAGEHSIEWDDRNDAGASVPSGTAMEARVLYHRINYRWDGVIGNTSASFTGSTVHHSMFPPTSIAIAAQHAVYTVGYNERLPGTGGFALEDPQHDVDPLEHPDAFAAWTWVATDGNSIYWANAGGLSNASFVVASAFQTGKPMVFAQGESVCLQFLGPVCYPGESYASVIDRSAEKSDAPTGLAVQTHGQILAVAHGAQGVVKLFDKSSGAFLRSIVISKGISANQLACAPNGDLWIIDNNRLLRYTQLSTAPTLAASITGLSHPLAVAVDPGNDDAVLVADGGDSQQVKTFDREGRFLWAYGKPGGYGTDPNVRPDKLWFYFDSSLERTALAIAPDGSFWVVDTCNDRMLHISKSRSYVEQVAYLPASYSATVDPNAPRRVFGNFLEYDVPTEAPLQPGPHAAWKLVRNWLAGLPPPARDSTARNGGFTGMQSVITLRNHRTYAVTSARGHAWVLELPNPGPARIAVALPAPAAGETARVLYEDGGLGFAKTNGDVQEIYRHALTGFDADGNPQWESAPQRLAGAPVAPDAPVYRGAFYGTAGPRFPVTSGSKVVFFDQSIAVANAIDGKGYHLGAVDLGGSNWSWRASPGGSFEQPGAFPTRAFDATVAYGGNILWAVGPHIVFGYHGEGFTDPVNRQVGEANRFQHFYEDGLFIGHFGVPTTRATSGAQAGVAGNSFSNILIGVNSASKLLFFHNDESQHGGIHRWTLDNLQSLHELTAIGLSGGTVSLR